MEALVADIANKAKAVEAGRPEDARERGRLIEYEIIAEQRRLLKR